MADNRAPGIYTEESKQRVGVNPAGASLSAFIGQARRGRVDRPVLCASWADFVTYFGGFSNSVDLGVHAWEFFSNSGAAARFLRIAGAGAAGATATVTDRAAATTFTAYASNPGKWGNSLSLSFTRSTIIAVGVPTDVDHNGEDLPTDCLALTLPTLAGISIGDTFQVTNPATGAVVDEITVSGYDIGGSAILFKDPGAFIAGCPADAVLRTNSMHRVQTVLASGFTNGGDYLDLDSVDGISIGSILTAHLISHCDTDPTVGLLRYGVGVVESISGKRVTFTSAFESGGVDIAAQTTAQLKYIKAGADGLRFTSKVAGPAGNEYTVEILAAQPVLTVTVTGKAIRIAAEAASTLANIKTAVEASAANALVSVAVIGSGAVVVGALPLTALTGGAQTIVTSQEFGAVLSEAGTVVESAGTFDYLSICADSVDWIGSRLGGTASPLSPSDLNASQRVLFAGFATPGLTAAAIFAQTPAPVVALSFAGGVDGASATDAEIVGLESDNTGLFAFMSYDDVDLIAAPGYTSSTVHKALARFAERQTNCTAIMDLDDTLASENEVLTYRQLSLGIDSSYAQVFAPYGKILDPRPTAQRGTVIAVPPSPMVCGQISRRAEVEGAHTSCGNLQPASWIALTKQFAATSLGSLNDNGINVIRTIAQRGIRIFGDRTLVRNNDSRKFGNVRRWLNYAKQSLTESMGVFLFRGADEQLFGDVYSVAFNFFEREWRRGALMPRNSQTAAFYVKCDQDTTTPADLVEGNVYVDIGVSPVTPAEKITFRMNIAAGGVSVDEN